MKCVLPWKIPPSFCRWNTSVPERFFCRKVSKEKNQQSIWITSVIARGVFSAWELSGSGENWSYSCLYLAAEGYQVSGLSHSQFPEQGNLWARVCLSRAGASRGLQWVRFWQRLCRWCCKAGRWEQELPVLLLKFSPLVSQPALGIPASL